jgi:EAL domain-containing protein (putative c-di-GMP-specific phosphodiesterase class I)
LIAGQDILDGIRNGEFHVVYQPQLLADGSRIAAVEALARWESPSHGPLGPTEFVPIAERDGVIDQLGAFVLRQACADATDWPEIAVSVNISPRQLLKGDFADLVETTVAEAGLPFARLELEIVESALIEDFSAVTKLVDRLRGQGVRIALDDFGTGYSSLTYLLKLPFDKLKMDKSLVEDVGTARCAAIVQSIVAMAKALGLKITAEGVETEAQQLFLRLCGCHYLQGHLFSPAVPAEAVTQMLKAAHNERRAV